MTSDSEIVAQMRVDNKQLAKDLNQSSAMMQGFANKVEYVTDKFSHKVVTKFNKLFYGQLSGSLIHMIPQALEGINEWFWKSFYGADEATNEYWKQANERIKSITNAVIAAEERYRKARDKYRDDNATPEGKAVYARQAKLNSDKEVQEAEDWLTLAKKNLQSIRDYEKAKGVSNASQKIAQEYTEAVAAAETNLLDAKAKNMELDTKADKAREDADEKKKAALEKQIELAKKLQEAETKAANAELAHRLQAIANSDFRKMSEAERFMPSLEEFARQQSWTGDAFTGKRRWHKSGLADMASGILGLKERAHNQFLNGDVTGAQKTIEDYNKKYDKMASMGLVPRRAEQVAEAQIRVAEYLEQIKDGKATLTTQVKLPE
jgi:hypothetical protein